MRDRSLRLSCQPKACQCPPMKKGRDLSPGPFVRLRLVDRPFPQDLRGAFLADFDHARQAPFRAFLDAAVEVAVVVAHREQIVRAVEAEVGAETVHKRAAGTVAADGAKSGSSRPPLSRQVSPAAAAAAARRDRADQRTEAHPDDQEGDERRRRAELMMPARLRLSMSMTPGPAAVSVEQLVVEEVHRR